MELQKAKLLLDKINALYKNMSADVDDISAVERDLMKTYVQQFYSVFLDLPTGKTTQAAPTKLSLNKPEPAPAPPQPAPRPTLVVQKQETPPPPPAPVEPPPPAPVIPPPPPPPVVEAPRPAPPPPPPPPPVPTAAPASVGADMEAVFDLGPTGKDLAERLGLTPIPDLKKAMGINERVFTVNELFGGNQAAFDETLTALNSFANYDQAKNYLASTVAPRFNWTEKEKIKKAQAFAKLVWRRYA